jgi:hypothetical protein
MPSSIPRPVHPRGPLDRKLGGSQSRPVSCGESKSTPARNLNQINRSSSLSCHYTDSDICSLQPPVHAGSSLADSSNLKIEVMRSSETSVHARSTWHHIPEDGILHSQWRENLKSYVIICKFHSIYW